MILLILGSCYNESLYTTTNTKELSLSNGQAAEQAPSAPWAKLI